MTKRSPARFGALMAIALTGGCSITSGQMEAPPKVSQPSQAGTLTLSRDGSLVGLFATIKLKLDGRDLYRLGRNQSFTLTLDPGEYLLEYSIGLNECSQIINMRTRRATRLRITPNCMMFTE